MIGPAPATRVDLATLVRRRGPLDPSVAVWVGNALLETVEADGRPRERLRPEHVSLSAEGLTCDDLDSAQGSSGATDARLVRDLGALFHFMLHGCLPWDADSFDATASATDAGLAKLTAKGAGSAAPTIPTALRDLLDWCLAESTPDHTLAELARRLSSTGLAARAPAVALAGLEPLGDERVGLVIAGRYRLAGVIGRGALATVYEAKIEGGGERSRDGSVALKWIEATGEGPDERAALERRLARELRSVARLQHPNVVATFDAGFDEALSAHYVVMERLQGSDLATFLERRGALDPLEAIDLCSQAARGLAAAHSAGLVHRDVKPANLFLHAPRRDAPAVVKVCDFGLARAHLADPAAAATRSGMLLGSPAYMSPEQLRDPRDADAQSDVWSLGVTLYQMLAGELPWRAAGPGPLLAAIAQRKIRRLHDVAPHLPVALTAVVDRALAGPRQERFRSMVEFDAALTEARAALQPAPRRRHRAPLLIGGAAMVVAAVVAGLIHFGRGLVGRDQTEPSTRSVSARDAAPPASAQSRCALTQASLKFSVRGLSVADVKRRAEAAGYVCAEWIEWWPLGAVGVSAVVFENPAEPTCGFSLFMGKPEGVLTMVEDETARTQAGQLRASEDAAFLLSTPIGCDRPTPASLIANP